MGFRSVKRAIAVAYLREVANSHIEKFPQMVTFSFDVIGNSINVDGRFEHEELLTLERVFSNQGLGGGYCIDIGANIGNHSVFFSSLFSSVIAFEPNEHTFKLLEFNCQEYDNITPIRYAASNKNVTLAAKVNRRNIGGTHVLNPGDTAIDAAVVEFPATTLDDWLQNNEIHETLEFIKLDVEGHELEALEGMSQTLSVSSPILAMEILDGQSTNAQDIIDFLKVHGFTYMYFMKSRRLFDRGPRLLSNLFLLLTTIFYKRPVHNFQLRKILELDKGPYPLIVFSKHKIKEF